MIRLPKTMVRSCMVQTRPGSSGHASRGTAVNGRRVRGREGGLQSGKRVLTQWFSYRKKNRERAIIGDRRPPSKLGDIQPDHSHLP